MSSTVTNMTGAQMDVLRSCFVGLLARGFCPASDFTGRAFDAGVAREDGVDILQIVTRRSYTNFKGVVPDVTGDIYVSAWGAGCPVRLKVQAELELRPETTFGARDFLAGPAGRVYDRASDGVPIPDLDFFHGCGDPWFPNWFRLLVEVFPVFVERDRRVLTRAFVASEELRAAADSARRLGDAQAVVELCEGTIACAP